MTMPSKKKKYNARFPPVSHGILYTSSTFKSLKFQLKLTSNIFKFYLYSFHYVVTQVSNAIFFKSQARIKKIMQTDEEVGKVAAAVPVIIYILFMHYAIVYYSNVKQVFSLTHFNYLGH